MARMYSRKRGRSGSTRPADRKTQWVKHKPKEVEEIILKLAKKGQQSAVIGVILRDQYGIPSVKALTGKTVAQIMKEGEAYPKFPEDMFNMLKKAVELRLHMDKNKKDYTSKRGLELTESKIRRLADYYKKQGLVPQDWRYDPEKAKLLVK